jgi:ribosomal protein S18 acetylase RimI-like enzyme
MEIRYTVNPVILPEPELVLTLLERAGISFPNWTTERMDRALKGSSVVVCAWHDDQLVGFARAITDFAWCAYLSQLAVMPQFQNQGIGKSLVTHIMKAVGEEVSLLVHSADKAIEFYKSTGFEPYSNVFRIKRQK